MTTVLRNLEKAFIIPMMLLNKNCDERWMSHADNMTDSQSLFFSRSFLVIYFHFTLLWLVTYFVLTPRWTLCKMQHDFRKPCSRNSRSNIRNPRRLYAVLTPLVSRSSRDDIRKQWRIHAILIPLLTLRQKRGNIRKPWQLMPCWCHVVTPQYARWHRKAWQLHAVLTPRSTLRHMRWERTLDGHAETMPNYNYNFIRLSVFRKKC